MSTGIATPPAATSAIPPGRMTAAEFVERYQGQRVEYLHGRVVEVPMAGFNHGEICVLASYHLTHFVMQNKLGRVVCNDTFINVPMEDDPTKVRGADVAYFSYDRLPKGESPKGAADVSPELVIEVKSPTDRWGNILAKVGEYLANDVLAVVVIDPPKKSAAVYTPDGEKRTITIAENLTVPEVLPGFEMPLAKLFE